MAYERLLVELDEEGWATFRLADQPPADQARGEFLVPKGFSRSDVFQAAVATLWVIERDGSLWIDRETNCATLAQFVCEMLFYFDAPSVPSKRLLKIKEAVDRWLAGAVQDTTQVSLWTCAWLDLMVREDAKEDIATADDVWHGEKLELDVARHCERRLRQVLDRMEASPELAAPAEAGRMAPSERARRPAQQQRRNVG